MKKGIGQAMFVYDVSFITNMHQTSTIGDSQPQSACIIDII